MSLRAATVRRESSEDWIKRTELRTDLITTESVDKPRSSPTVPNEVGIQRGKRSSDIIISVQCRSVSIVCDVGGDDRVPKLSCTSGRVDDPAPLQVRRIVHNRRIGNVQEPNAGRLAGDWCRPKAKCSNKLLHVHLSGTTSLSVLPCVRKLSSKNPRLIWGINRSGPHDWPSTGWRHSTGTVEV